MAARVCEQHRSGYLVATDLETAPFAVDSLPQWQKPQFPPDQRAAVGDWVLLDSLDGSRPQILALLPRYSVIKRAAAGEHFRQQLIAANIDVAFVVCGLDLDFNSRRLERYLVLIPGTIRAVVVFTKIDIAQVDAAQRDAVCEQLNEQGIEWIALSAKDPQQVAQLKRWLMPGTTAVFVGSSGVGKSTLSNTLLGEERLKTNAVREHDSRGKHTTTVRSLQALPGGACLIDTPGMRELKPSGEEAIADRFEDIEALAAQCKFRDCRHRNEPCCAVLAAIAAGTLDPQRLAHYQKLGGEIDRAAHALQARLATQAQDKILSKALNKRLKQKRETD